MAVAIALFAARDGARGEGPSRPDVIVIMTDDQTVEAMRVMPRTRRLIGDAGITFANSFVSYPLCCPSRATLLTGQYAHNHKVLGNRPPTGGYGALDTGETVPVWLRRAGYHTAHIGKYLNGYGRDVPADVPPGWDEWYGAVDPSTYNMWGYTLNENGTLRTYGAPRVEDPALYQTDVYRDKAIDVIRRGARDSAPLYLSVAFLAPHAEALRGARGAGPASVRSAPRHRGALAGEATPRPRSFDEADVSDKPALLGRNYARLTPAQQQAVTARYRGRLESLLAVDEAVEQIVAALDETGRLDDTLLLFTSDNGFFGGEHRIPQGKYFVYEPSARVPLLMRGPGVRHGTTSREQVGNVDLAATVLDAAGARAGRTLDGRSLLRFAADPRERTRRALLMETGQTARNGDLDQDGGPGGGARRGSVPTYRAIRTSRYLYVQYSTRDEELYDLRRDPDELRSRHDDRRYAATRLALQRALRGLRRCRGSSCRRELAPIPAPR